jgi:SAM-dependent methyltransferase
MAFAASSHLTGRARAIPVFVFSLSAVGFAFQVLLTRLFSVIFQYHYVFVIVSVAIAGLSIGAALVVLVRRNRQRVDEWHALTYGTAGLALLLVVVTVVLMLLPSANLLAVVLVAALLPYVAIGFLNALVFARFAPFSGVLYAADLIGGALGLVIAFGVIGWIGAFEAVILLGVICGFLALIPAWIGDQQRLQIKVSGLVALLMVGFLVNRLTALADFTPASLSDAPPDKTMMHVLQDSRAMLIETRWDAFARIDVVTTADDTFRYVFTDAGAGSIMVRYDGDTSAVEWLTRDIEYLPFTIDAETGGSVLILGAGAGRDVLMARLAGAESITAIEINPAIVDVTREAADYNGSVFDLPGVSTIVADGRNYIERSDKTYDLIYANVVYSQAAAPGSSALAENYIFTREALQTYWERISDQGRIGFVTHHGIEGLRLIVAALDVLQADGMTLQQALRHVALVSRSSGDPQTRTSVVMITRQPWTQQAAAEFVSQVHRRGAGALYMPYYLEVGFEPMIQGVITLDDYIRINSDFNYTPATDDSPFFYQFRPGLPGPLADLLLISVFLAFVYLSWLIFFYVRPDQQQWKRASLAPYFALLGVGFLLIEAPLIQRFSLLLGQPVLALITVVGALLIGSGLGSLFSSRFPVEALPRLVMVFALGTGVMVLISLAVYPALIRWALPMDLWARLLVTAAALFPLGFLMGVPFPSGLRVAHQVDPQGVAAFWGANATTSGLGAAVAMALAIYIGFSAAFVLGVVLYAVIALLTFATWPRLLSHV